MHPAKIAALLQKSPNLRDVWHSTWVVWSRAEPSCHADMLADKIYVTSTCWADIFVCF